MASLRIKNMTMYLIITKHNCTVVEISSEDQKELESAVNVFRNSPSCTQTPNTLNLKYFSNIQSTSQGQFFNFIKNIKHVS